MPQPNNWIGLYDSGKKLLDQIIVPAGTLQANQSYARVSDAANEWEVKGSSADKYVTPSTNNKTINSQAKMEKFEEHDSSGYWYVHISYECRIRTVLLFCLLLSKL